MNREANGETHEVHEDNRIFAKYKTRVMQLAGYPPHPEIVLYEKIRLLIVDKQLIDRDLLPNESNYHYILNTITVHPL